MTSHQAFLRPIRGLVYDTSDQSEGLNMRALACFYIGWMRISIAKMIVNLGIVYDIFMDISREFM